MRVFTPVLRMADQNTGIPTCGPWNGAMGKDLSSHVKPQGYRLGGDDLAVIHQHYFGKYLVKNPSKAFNVHFTWTGHRMRSSPAVSAAWLPAAHGCCSRRAIFGQKLPYGKPVLQKYNVSWLVCEQEVMVWDLRDTLGTNVISWLILLITHLQ